MIKYKMYPAHKESAIDPHRERDVGEDPFSPTGIVKLGLEGKISPMRW